MSVSMVAAVSQNGVIGLAGDMPWGRGLKPDLRRFKAVTLGHPIVMGRKTWDSLGKALPGRTNIVISRSAQTLPEGVLAARDLDEALALGAQAPGGEEVMVIGGGQIYAAALPRATRLYLTRVLKDFEGDTRFPALNDADWAPMGQVRGDYEGLPYSLLTLQRTHLI
jgi:dihydrofolate reductase